MHNESSPVVPTLAGQTPLLVRPRPLTWPQRGAATLAYLLIRTLAATLRFELRDRSQLLGELPSRPIIFAIWHNRLALSLIVHRQFVQPRAPERRLAAMVSASKDGGIFARILEHFGVDPVRGSSSRRGPQALLELTNRAARGFDLAITPDGPRGPRYHVQHGVIALAQLTALPIVPVSYFLQWKIPLRSWDQFQIPLPFSRCRVEFGPPLRVPKNASPEQRDSARLELEKRLLEITQD